jgi:hypothetical protein
MDEKVLSLNDLMFAIFVLLSIIVLIGLILRQYLRDKGPLELEAKYLESKCFDLRSLLEAWAESEILLNEEFSGLENLLIEILEGRNGMIRLAIGKTNVETDIVNLVYSGVSIDEWIEKLKKMNSERRIYEKC